MKLYEHLIAKNHGNNRPKYFVTGSCQSPKNRRMPQLELSFRTTFLTKNIMFDVRVLIIPAYITFYPLCRLQMTTNYGSIIYGKQDAL